MTLEVSLFSHSDCESWARAPHTEKGVAGSSNDRRVQVTGTRDGCLHALSYNQVQGAGLFTGCDPVGKTCSSQLCHLSETQGHTAEKRQCWIHDEAQVQYVSVTASVIPGTVRGDFWVPTSSFVSCELLGTDTTTPCMLGL